MAINLTDLINSIKALDKTNKRLFFTAWSNESEDAFSPTQAEIDAQNLASWNALKSNVGKLFNITVPDSVTVPQIKTYLNTWIDNKAKLMSLVGDLTKFKALQVLEADANGGDVNAYLQQARKLYWMYGK